jgi:ribonuclease HII
MLKRCHTENIFEAGCDEAGRGSLAGPVFAAAVILPADYHNHLLDDSKRVNPKSRLKLRNDIEKNALAWAVAWVGNEIIDELNILNASILAMHQALDKLKVRPDHILVDGNRFYAYHSIPHTCIIKGDALYAPIAAASILAKTHRDEFMVDLHQYHNQYNWDRNKGYPTAKHRTAIRHYGITPFHRKSFSLFGTQLEINF